MRGVALNMMPVDQFQSAPGREAGRCLLLSEIGEATLCFNPRPAVRPGDASASAESRSKWLTFQSAPGREAGRCKEPKARELHNSCFNPRPAVRPGDAMQSIGSSRPDTVSIRARP